MILTCLQHWNYKPEYWPNVSISLYYPYVLQLKESPFNKTKAPFPNAVYFVPVNNAEEQCFSTAGPRPGTGPCQQLYRALVL
jgi:hypothetical protein